MLHIERGEIVEMKVKVVSISDTARYDTLSAREVIALKEAEEKKGSLLTQEEIASIKKEIN